MIVDCLIHITRGVCIGASLIIAIGAQNAFVLKQGLLKNTPFAIAFFCASMDASLIVLGNFGFGTFLAQNMILLTAAKWGGAFFLFLYGGRSFLSIFKNKHFMIGEKEDKPSLKKTLFTLSLLTFLNPHVYLDTVVLLGSIGAQMRLEDRVFFVIGAITASFIWFFSLSYGARFLLPFFKKPISWKLLDGCIALVMWYIAISLLLA